MCSRCLAIPLLISVLVSPLLAAPQESSAVAALQQRTLDPQTSDQVLFNPGMGLLAGGSG